MQVCALVALRAEAVFGELFALALIAEVEGVCELAVIALFAQTALVMFADQMAYPGALFFGHVVAIWTGGTQTAFSCYEVLADGLVYFGGRAEGGDVGL